MATIIKKKLAAYVFIRMEDEDRKHIDNYVMDRTCVDMEVLVNSLPAYRLGVAGKNIKATIRLHLRGYKK